MPELFFRVPAVISLLIQWIFARAFRGHHVLDSVIIPWTPYGDICLEVSLGVSWQVGIVYFCILADIPLELVYSAIISPSASSSFLLSLHPPSSFPPSHPPPCLLPRPEI